MTRSLTVLNYAMAMDRNWSDFCWNLPEEPMQCRAVQELCVRIILVPCWSQLLTNYTQPSNNILFQQLGPTEDIHYAQNCDKRKELRTRSWLLSDFDTVSFVKICDMTFCHTQKLLSYGCQRDAVFSKKKRNGFGTHRDLRSLRRKWNAHSISHFSRCSSSSHHQKLFATFLTFPQQIIYAANEI